MSYPFSHAFRRPVSFVVIAALASLGTVVLMPSVVSASGTDTWTGAAGDGNWGTANNWAGHAVPASGDNVVFPAGAPLTVTVNVSATVQSITINASDTFTGGTINLTGNATISQPVTSTNTYFEDHINFAGTPSVTTSTGYGAVIAFNTVSGTTTAFNITNGSGGAVMLVGPMTYTATAITVVSGTLQNLGEGAYGNGPITVDSGATVENNIYSIPNNFTISGNGYGGFGSAAIETGASPTLLTGTVTLATDATVGPEPIFQNVVNVGTHTLSIVNPYGTGTPTFSAAVVGTGAVDLNGPETFLFTAAGTTVPSIALVSGTRQIIDVTGSMPFTAINASGGLIEGTGTIGSVTSGGTILGGSTVNNNAAGGILTIESQPSLSPSMQLQVEDASASQYGSVAVIGALNLDGATLLQPTDGASSLGNVYTILTSTGALTGTFAGDPDGTIIQDNNGADFVIHYLANSVTLTDVGPIPTSFTASATPSSVAYGATSTLAESGLPGGATGTVTFASGGSTLCAATLPATSCTTSPTLSGGTYPITATYSGGGLNAGSSTTTSLTVSPLATSFSAAATPQIISFGSTSTLSESGLAGSATGTVAFTSGGSTFCVATLPTTTCTTSATLAARAYSIVATYSGDADNAGSTAYASLTVMVASTTFIASATPASVPFGASSALAASGLPGAATGSVTFTSGGTTLCTTLLPATTCDTPTTLDAGSYPISATYSGDSNDTGFTATTSLTVTPVTTSFTATATPANVSYGTSSTLAETGLPSGATGTVVYASGGSTLCTALLPQTTCDTAASLAAGTYPVTATYSGDLDDAGSTASTALTVGLAATSFTAAASPTSITYGDSDSLSATGLPGAATGSVTFASGGSTLCVASLPTTTCGTSASLGAGAYSITATYSGDSDYAGSTASTSLTVTRAPTAVFALASPSSVAFGTSTTLEAIALDSGATGTVTFVAGASTLCVATLPVTSCATPTTLAAGLYQVIATYSGDANFAGSAASTVFQVTRATTSFTASATPASVAYGTSATLTEAGLPGGAAGTVAFASGAATLCTATLPIATCETATTLGAGTYPIIATYSGDADHSTSTASTSLTITKAPTLFTASATPATVVHGSSATLAETGLPLGATGTVVFRWYGTTLCTATLPMTSCLTPTTLAAWTYPIIATYSGDQDEAGSTATTFLTVSMATTSFTASATPTTVPYGTSSTLAESGLPGGVSGTVVFASAGATLCTATLPSTSCSTATSLGTGTYPITATYSGDGGDWGSTASTSLTVVRASTAFAATATPSSVAFGTSDTLAAVGLPGAATGTVTFVSGGATFCVATLPTTTCATSALLPAGVYSITATYSGDADDTGSTASTSLTVTRAATTTAVTSSLNPAAPGQAVSYTARVATNPGSGTVSFTDNGLAIAGCTAVPVNPLTGNATCSTTYPDAGTFLIGATFSGNADFAASSAPTSGALVLVEAVDAAVTVPSTGSAGGTNLAQELAGGAVALLGFLTIWGARRRRVRTD